MASDMMVISRAKELDLLEFVESQVGIKVFRQGASYGSSYCPHCGQSPDKHSNRVCISRNLWNCFFCKKGGSVVDYAMYLWEVSNVDAAKKLLGGEQGTPILKTATKVDPQEEIARQQAVSDVVKRLSEIGLTEESDCIAYLTEARKLPRKIVDEAVSRGIVRFLPFDKFRAAHWLQENVGMDLMVNAGMWTPGKKMPAAAWRPIVFILPSLTSAEFRMARDAGEGERKALRYGSSSVPWCWEGRPGSKATTEGAIDMLSLAALGFEGTILGLPGCQTWQPEWLAGEGKKYICFDPDTAGTLAAEKFLTGAKNLGIQDIEVRPPTGGDVNDLLRSRAK